MPKNPWTLRKPKNRELLGKFGGIGDNADTAFEKFCAFHGIGVDGTDTAETTPSQRMADIYSEGGGDRQRAENGEITPAEDYAPYLLYVLLKAPGHQLPSKEAKKRVFELIKSKLKPIDLERLPESPEIRWRNKVDFCRMNMMPHKPNPKRPNLKPHPHAGYLDPKAGRGRWRLSDTGLKAAKAVKL
jgi:hypothetical protein